MEQVKQEQVITGYIKEVLSTAESYAVEHGLNSTDSSHLRLISEETVEMLKMTGNEAPSDFQISGDDNGCVLRLTFDEDVIDKSETDYINYKLAKGITGKISALIRSRYDTLAAQEEDAESIGVRKALAGDFKDIGADSREDAYVWSIEAYNLTSIDKLADNDDESWFEVSRSIIANLADDIRLFIYRDRTVLSIYTFFNRDRTDVKEKYGISPEFEALSRVPVPKTRFQIKLVQLLYGRLVNKQTSTADVEVKRLDIKSPSSPKGSVTVLEYSPTGIIKDDSTPCVLFLHGGAFLFPALPYHYRLAVKITREVGCRLFLVMHDLAPKFNPPVQTKEALDVYRHLLDNSDDYHIDPSHIAIMGDSSGGTMTAALTLLTRDLGLTMPVGQLLLYPSLDSRKDSESMESFSDVPVVNADSINVYRKIIKADRSEGNKYYISPAEAESLAGLPRSYVETAEFDALHDEGVAYAKRMIKEGNDVILNETKGTVHSFDMAQESTILAGVMEKRIGFLKEIFEIQD